MATGGFQESIGYISKIQEQQITRWMNIYQALISVHLVISCSFSEGHFVFLGYLIFENILHHGLSTRDIAKQEEGVTWVL